MRIVSLVPSQTELLADLGLDEEVIGLTRFCVHPENWKARKTIVGGTKNLLPERIAALQPDLILANREENVREQVEPLAELAHVHVTDVATVDDALAMIREVGQLVGHEKRAAALAREIEAGFNALVATTGPALRAAYLIWREPYMTVGGDTFISDVMARAGLVNVFAHRTRYPEVTPEEIAALGAEVVLLSSEPYPFDENHAHELVATIPGVRVELVDGEPFSWYGSRMRLAPEYLTALRQSLTG
jgi:ABC-type Fe3+-hydroxamate transport system substrate-binding protein